MILPIRHQQNENRHLRCTITAFERHFSIQSTVLKETQLHNYNHTNSTIPSLLLRALSSSLIFHIKQKVMVLHQCKQWTGEIHQTLLQEHLGFQKWLAPESCAVKSTYIIIMYIDVRRCIYVYTKMSLQFWS